MKVTSSFAFAAASNAAPSSRKRSRSSSRRAPRGAARDQPLELAAHFEQAQLAAHVDLGDDDAAARKDRDQSLAREALQRLADRRAADAEARRQLVSEIALPGASFSVTIISSISAYARSVRLGAGASSSSDARWFIDALTWG